MDEEKIEKGIKKVLLIRVLIYKIKGRIALPFLYALKHMDSEYKLFLLWLTLWH